MSAHRLAGKHALITGASRGIGRAVAERFAREGATVAINAVGDGTEAQEALAAVEAATHAGGHPAAPHRIVMADVADPAAVERMVGTLVGDWGRLDILVNNAGIQSETPGERFDDATFARILAVNLAGAAFCARAAIRHFLTRPGGGAVVNTSSVHEMVPKPGYLAYSMSKGGLGNLTRTLALEFAGRGIRVNAVGPGAVATDLNRSWTEDERARTLVESHIPIGFAADPAEIAPVFAFLASDEARYVTGQTLYACGGLTLYPEFRENWAS